MREFNRNSWSALAVYCGILLQRADVGKGRVVGQRCLKRGPEDGIPVKLERAVGVRKGVGQQVNLIPGEGMLNNGYLQVTACDGAVCCAGRKCSCCCCFSLVLLRLHQLDGHVWKQGHLIRRDNLTKALWRCWRLIVAEDNEPAVSLVLPLYKHCWNAADENIRSDSCLLKAVLLRQHDGQLNNTSRRGYRTRVCRVPDICEMEAGDEGFDRLRRHNRRRSTFLRRNQNQDFLRRNICCRENLSLN